eukprot:113623-Amphidinium_carterae.1
MQSTSRQCSRSRSRQRVTCGWESPLRLGGCKDLLLHNKSCEPSDDGNTESNNCRLCSRPSGSALE